MSVMKPKKLANVGFIWNKAQPQIVNGYFYNDYAMLVIHVLENMNLEDQEGKCFNDKNALKTVWSLN